MAKQIITPAPTTQAPTQPTAAQAYAQAYALALTAVQARKAAEKAAAHAAELKDEEREAKRMVKSITQPAPAHTPLTLDETDDTPAGSSASVAQWIIAASLASLAILILSLIIVISIH